MNLLQLKSAIDTALKIEKNAENINVVITTKVPYAYCGQRPCTNVASAGMGFDFEAGQFRITPEEDLMCIKDNVPQKVIEFSDMYFCPKCEYALSVTKSNSIKFCSKCGQAVAWDE